MSPPNWREWFYSLKAFSAAMLALYIALSLHLQNPYWALSTVYIVSHPLSGATSSKAIFRVIGTVTGATGAIILVPLMASTPIMLSLAIAAWTGTFLYFAMLIRTPTSYSLLLSGYTLPIIAIPSIMNPLTVFDSGLARTEEIVVGIVCSAVVSTVVFPNRIAPVMTAQIGRILNDAAAWATSILTRGAQPEEGVRASHKLVADVIALDSLVVHLSFDSNSKVQARKARELRQRMTMLVPQLSGLLDPLLQTHLVEHTRHEDVYAIVDGVVTWMKSGTDAVEQPATLRERMHELRERTGSPSTHDQLWALTVLARVDELVDLWSDCLSLEADFRRGVPDRDVALRYGMPWGVGRTAQHDHPMLIYKAVSVAACVACACILWLNLGWAAAAGGVASVAVSYCFFAALDDPAPRIRSFFDWLLVGTAIAFVYIFAIFPGVHTFTGLALVLAPPLLIVGAFTGRPQLTGLVLLFMVQSISELGLKEAYNGDFDTFINPTVASLLGCVFAIVWASVTTPFGVRYLAARLARANWSDLERVATSTDPRNTERLAARMIDRYGQILPRLSMLDNSQALRNDTLREVRLSLRLGNLIRDASGLAADELTLVTRVRQELGAWFRACRKTGGRVRVPSTLLPCIDTAISALLGGDSDATTHVCIDLASLRYAIAADMHAAPGENAEPTLSTLPLLAR